MMVGIISTIYCKIGQRKLDSEIYVSDLHRAYGTSIIYVIMFKGDCLSIDIYILKKFLLLKLLQTLQHFKGNFYILSDAMTINHRDIQKEFE